MRTISDEIYGPLKINLDFKRGVVTSKQAVYLLKILIEDSLSLSTRILSIETLRSLNNSSIEVFEILESCLISDENKYIREKAAKVLFELFPEKGLPALGWALQREKSPKVINTLLEISDQINSPKLNQLKQEKKVALSESYGVIPEELETIMKLEVILNKHNINLFKENYQHFSRPLYLNWDSNFLHFDNQEGFYASAYSVSDRRIVGLHIPKMDTIPKSISLFSELEYLSIPDAKSIPQWLTSFAKLKGLRIDKKRKLRFPEDILKLQHLRLLFICYSNFHPISQKLCNLIKQNVAPKYIKQRVHLDDAIILAKLEVLLGQEIELNNDSFSETVFNLNERGRVIHLKLCDNRHYCFDFIPSFIFSFKYLESLNLQGNQIGVIPYMIKRLKNLRELNLAYNPIKCIPDSLSSLKSLEKLDLCDSSLTEFPEALTKLINLKYLNLTETNISEFSIFPKQ